MPTYRVNQHELIIPERTLLTAFPWELAEQERILPMAIWNAQETIILVTDRELGRKELARIFSVIQKALKEAATLYQIHGSIEVVSTEEWNQHWGRAQHARNPESIAEQDNGGSAQTIILETVTAEDGRNVLADLDLLEEGQPVQRLAGQILARGITNRASDIRIHPLDGRGHVLYRVDGRWEADRNEMGLDTLRQVMMVFATCTNVDITNLHRTGGDAKLSTSITQHGAIRRFDVRLSFMPIKKKGEASFNLVMRLLDKAAAFHLNQLDLSPTNLNIVQRSLRQPYGMVIVTGPTGSGKSTLLHGGIRWVLEEFGSTKHIITIEDPIEYELDDVTQTEVDEKQGRTFNSLLRQSMRHAPQVILVGEIRDTETAQISVRAAKTGHLILTTLHTNDALGAPSRLVNLGVQPVEVGAVLMTVLAQRLVRKVNPECCTMGQVSAGELKSRWGLLLPGTSESDLIKCPMPKPNLPRGARLTKGRLAVHEVWRVNDRVRELVNHGASEQDLRAMAISDGFQPMIYDGRQKMEQGLISPGDLAEAIQGEL